MEQVNNMDKVIDQIRKLLALAGNNPCEQEAISAALKAQAMMAKYNIDIADVEDEAPKAEEMAESFCVYADGHTMTNWKLHLAGILAKNFRVKTYIKGNAVAFFGHKTDTQIAAEVFRYLTKAGNKLAVKAYNEAKKEGLNTRGVMNSYLLGFIKGVADVLEKQCVALMIVTPQDVEDAYAEKSKGWGHKRASMNGSEHSRYYGQGRSDGQSVANSRAIEG